MGGKIAVEVVRNGLRDWRPLPDPPHGKGYIVVPIDNVLINKINTLDGHGHWDKELSDLLAREIENFFRTRPIAIKTPGKTAQGLKLYDPRDPRKDPIS